MGMLQQIAALQGMQMQDEKVESTYSYVFAKTDSGTGSTKLFCYLQRTLYTGFGNVGLFPRGSKNNVQHNGSLAFVPSCAKPEKRCTGFHVLLVEGSIENYLSVG